MDPSDVRSLYLTYLGQASGLNATTCKNIEVGIYNWTIRFAKKNNISRRWGDPVFMDAYKHKAFHIAANLDPKSYVGNTQLIERLNKGEVRAHDLAGMQPRDLFPERWAKAVQNLEIKLTQALNPVIVPKTTRFRCNRCKSNVCTYYSLQIRSADEPSTLFIMCLTCGSQWRING